MSSRLLTMKFMQRAAASSNDPSSPDEHPAKRQKQSGDSSASVDVASLVDQRAIQAAITEEERVRQAALDKAAEQAGDTHWVLKYENQDADEMSSSKKPLRIIETGYASIDNDDNELDTSSGSPMVSGRRSFGQYNREVEVIDRSCFHSKFYLTIKQKLQTPNMKKSSSSDSDDDDDDSVSSGENDDETDAMIRAARMQASEQVKASRKEKKQADKAEIRRLAALRRNREVDPNRLPTSISGGGSSPNLKKSYPNRKRNHSNDDGGRPRKARKSY